MTTKVLDQAHGKMWQMYNADSIEVLRGLPDKSIHLSVYSPPFANKYSYSPSDRDIGNSLDYRQFFNHYSYLTEQLARCMVPGRIVAVHCKPLPRYETRDGVTGRYDLPGDLVRHYEKFGFIWQGQFVINKDPHRPSRLYHPKNLLYATLESDSIWNCAYEPDHVLIFRTPGANPIPVKPNVSRREWDTMAHPVWNDVQEIDVLNTDVVMRGEGEPHICPLQLPVISRIIRLYSNRGEVIFSPFGGIGSEPVTAVKEGRYGLACELKPEYYEVAVKYLELAELEATQQTLFDFNVLGETAVEGENNLKAFPPRILTSVA